MRLSLCVLAVLIDLQCIVVKCTAAIVLGADVYMLPDRVPFRYNFILVPYSVAIFVYMMPTKISFQYKSFQNEFIPVVAPD